MINWLKFYFLGFFSHKLSRQGAARSFFNCFLSLVLTLLLLSGGLALGNSLSFGSHYSKAEEFREFLYSAFAGEDAASRIGLTMSGGTLSADIPGGDQVNGFAYEEDGYTVNGYRLIVDTREAATAFDDFSLLCYDAAGNEISYAEFRALSEEAQNKGSWTVVYSGISLDTAANQSGYLSWLDRVADPTDGEYDADIAEEYASLNLSYASGGVTAQSYADSLYILYVRSYYPSFSDVESYAEAPTLRTYYLGAQSVGEQKYLILLNDICLCSFVTDSGVVVSFGSYYSSNADGTVCSDGMTSAQRQTAVDRFIRQAFRSSGGLNFLIYLMNDLKFILLLAALLFLLAVACFLLFRAARRETDYRIFGMMKVAGSFLLFDAFLCFIAAIVLCFFCSVSTVFTVLEILCAALVVARTAVFAVTECIVSPKRKPQEEEGAGQ